MGWFTDSFSYQSLYIIKFVLDWFYLIVGLIGLAIGVEALRLLRQILKAIESRRR